MPDFKGTTFLTVQREERFLAIPYKNHVKP